jgi:hypothetical protein
MTDFIKKITDWIKSNLILAILLGAGILLVFFSKQIMRLFVSPRRRRRKVAPKQITRRSPRRITRVNRIRKPLPRSVGTNRKGYPAAGGGTIPFKYNKDGTVKKAWQVGGTVAAKSRMKRLRKNR